MYTIYSIGDVSHIPFDKTSLYFQCAHIPELLKIVTMIPKWVVQVSFADSPIHVKTLPSVLKALPLHVTHVDLGDNFLCDLELSFFFSLIQSLSSSVVQVDLRENFLYMLGAPNLCQLIEAFDPQVAQISLSQNNLYCLQPAGLQSVLKVLRVERVDLSRNWLYFLGVNDLKWALSELSITVKHVDLTYNEIENFSDRAFDDFITFLTQRTQTAWVLEPEILCKKQSVLRQMEIRGVNFSNLYIRHNQEERRLNVTIQPEQKSDFRCNCFFALASLSLAGLVIGCLVMQLHLEVSTALMVTGGVYAVSALTKRGMFGTAAPKDRLVNQAASAEF